MQLIAPDILEAIRGLSVVGCVIGLVVGVLLWLFGWWGHRFWIVLFTTVAAGIAGLASGRSAGVAPLVAGLLLAVSAGMMALALARVVAFVAGGVATCLLMQLLIPTWDDRLLCFLGGGLAGLLFFRLWMMLLTSLGGTLLMGYATLLLLDKLGKLDALVWAEQRTMLLNWSGVGLTLAGLLAQLLVERWRKQFKRSREENAHLQQAQMELEHRFRKKSWWKFGAQQPRQAA